MARRVSDSLAIRLHDQQFTRRHAAEGRGPPRRIRADVGDARRARLGRSLVGNGARSRRQDRPRHRRGAAVGQHARERHDRAPGRAVVPASVRARRRRIVCTAMDFPSMVYLYRAQEALGFELHVVPVGARLDGGRESPARRDRRADGGRLLLARALPDFLHHGRGGHRGARARGRRAGDSRHVPIGGHHPRRRHGARRRLRGRRLPEVAVRRTGKRVSLHTSRRPRRGAAFLHGMALAGAAVRVRHRCALACDTTPCG